MAGRLTPEVRVFPDDETLAREGAAWVATRIGSGLRRRGRFHLVLSGGRTPRALNGALARIARDRIDWSCVHFFWGDERCVPPEDPESNYRMASETLLEGLDVPSENVHRIPVEEGPAVQVAKLYESELRRHFPDGPFPRFDLTILGVGEDGHTASLFPRDGVLEERVHWVRAVTAPEGVEPPERVTLTYPALEGSRRILYLVTGSSKARVVASILREERETELHPAARVQPTGRVHWFLDREAGAFLFERR
jgi:6-phosphogluconolactonase